LQKALTKHGGKDKERATPSISAEVSD